MKSLLLFLMVPTAICAMDMERGMDVEKPPASQNVEPFWQARQWITVHEHTDKGRQETLLTIHHELDRAVQIISQHISYEQRQPVLDLLNQWLTEVQLHQQSFSTQTDRSEVDKFIDDTYAKQEDSIGQAVTNLEASLKENPINALSSLMNSLLVTNPAEELLFDNSSLDQS